MLEDNLSKWFDQKIKFETELSRLLKLSKFDHFGVNPDDVTQFDILRLKNLVTKLKNI